MGHPSSYLLLWIASAASLSGFADSEPPSHRRRPLPIGGYAVEGRDALFGGSDYGDDGTTRSRLSMHRHQRRRLPRKEPWETESGGGNNLDGLSKKGKKELLDNSERGNRTNKHQREDGRDPKRKKTTANGVKEVDGEKKYNVTQKKHLSGKEDEKEEGEMIDHEVDEKKKDDGYQTNGKKQKAMVAKKRERDEAKKKKETRGKSNEEERAKDHESYEEEEVTRKEEIQKKKKQQQEQYQKQERKQTMGEHREQLQRLDKKKKKKEKGGAYYAQSQSDAASKINGGNRPVEVLDGSWSERGPRCVCVKEWYDDEDDYGNWDNGDGGGWRAGEGSGKDGGGGGGKKKNKKKKELKMRNLASAAGNGWNDDDDDDNDRWSFGTTRRNKASKKSNKGRSKGSKKRTDGGKWSHEEEESSSSRSIKSKPPQPPRWPSRRQPGQKKCKKWACMTETRPPSGGGTTPPPSITPTLSPSISPTLSPTLVPTLSPTLSPTLFPTIYPTVSPTILPTMSPTLFPTMIPTLSPTNSPTDTWSGDGWSRDGLSSEELFPGGWSGDAIVPPTPSATNGHGSWSGDGTMAPTKRQTHGPTACDGRTWHYSRTVKGCTNTSVRRDGDDGAIYDSARECCLAELGFARCNVYDTCAPTSPPSSTPTKSPPTSSPTACTERKWHYSPLNNGCANTDAGDSDNTRYYGSARICCFNEFGFSSCAKYDMCAPTSSPSDDPTMFPTIFPTLFPTKYPTLFPTQSPSTMKSWSGDSWISPPHAKPTKKPTKTPTKQPTKMSGNPTKRPAPGPVTDRPTRRPNEEPVTDSPTTSPGVPSDAIYYWDFEEDFPDPPTWTTSNEDDPSKIWGLSGEEKNSGDYSIKSPELWNAASIAGSSNATFITDPDWPPGKLTFHVLPGVSMPIDNFEWYLDGVFMGKILGPGTEFEPQVIQLEGGGQPYRVDFVYNYNPYGLSRLPPNLSGAVYLDDIWFVPHTPVTNRPSRQPVRKPVTNSPSKPPIILEPTPEPTRKPTCADCICDYANSDTGFIQIPNTECARFAECFNGCIVQELFCPEGTIFDSILGVCNWTYFPFSAVCREDPPCGV